MPEYTRYQLLLMSIRDKRCGGNAAQLARQIGKDATYVHRLFYPTGKKGAKGIGLGIMEAASKAFDLPPGFWDQNIAPPDIKANVVSEALSEYNVSRQPNDSGLWPFKSITPSQYSLLTDEEMAHVEFGIELIVRAREPTKRNEPASITNTQQAARSV